jgi:ATP-dependent DNA helicase RecQ
MQTEDEYPKLKLTEKSSDVLKGLVKVQLVKTKVLQEAKPVYHGIDDVAYEHELYDILKALRKSIADNEHVPAYIILGDTSLVEMAAYLPDDLHQLKKISGFGDVKLQRYGEEFISRIREYCNAKNLKSRIHLKEPKRERKSAKAIKSASGQYKNTYQTTLDMHRQGLTINEIAEQRQMSPQTVATHLASFVASGEVNAEAFVPREKIEQIRNLIDKYGYMSLKTIKENAGSDITYNDIKFVVSEIKSA